MRHPSESLQCSRSQLGQEEEKGASDEGNAAAGGDKYEVDVTEEKSDVDVSGLEVGSPRPPCI